MNFEAPKPIFSRRSNQAEIMDDLEGRGPDWYQALRELRIINKFLGGNGVTLEGLNQLLKNRKERGPVTLADLGCGGGDMLVEMAEWGRRNRIPMRLLGVDANPNIIEYARENTAAYPEIEYRVADIFSENFRKLNFDIVTCTLFTHHFRNEQLVDLLSHLHRQVRIGLVINDLHRHPLAFYSIKALTAAFSRSKMVKHDAPVSVARAFSRRDWKLILKEAEVKKYSLSWRWAFRWLLLLKSEGNRSGDESAHEVLKA